MNTQFAQQWRKSELISLSRWTRLVVGHLIIVIAFWMVYEAGLGLGPLHVLQDGIHLNPGMTMGLAAIVIGIVLLVGAIALGQLPGPATLFSVVALGVMTDLTENLIPKAEGAVAEWFYLIAGTLVMAFGAALYLSARMGASPYDAVMNGLYLRLRPPLFAVRIGMEFVALVLGFLAGGQVGLGCFVVGVGIGPAIHLFLVILKAMPEDSPPKSAAAPSAIAPLPIATAD